MPIKRKLVAKRKISTSRIAGKRAVAARRVSVNPVGTIASDCGQRCPQDCDSGSLAQRASRPRARVRKRIRTR